MKEVIKNSKKRKDKYPTATAVKKVYEEYRNDQSTIQLVFNLVPVPTGYLL